jgi:signal transduction histidine kinase
VERARLLLTQVDRVAGIVRAGLDRGPWPVPLRQQEDLTVIAVRMARFLEPSFTDAGVQANVPADEAPPVLASCDPAMVEQILLNLLKNAVEALHGGGTVTITTGHAEHQAYIDIQDDGPGLDADAASNLFRPFSTTKGPLGMGLGLAVSRRLARLLGGDLIHLPSARGVRWRLTLPVEERA